MSICSGRFNLEQQRWNSQPSDTEKRHWRCSIYWPELSAKNVKVFQRLVYVGGVNSQSNNIGETHVCTIKHGFEVVESQSDLTACQPGVVGCRPRRQLFARHRSVADCFLRGFLPGGNRVFATMTMDLLAYAS